MSKLKIKIQPLFIIYLFLCIYFDWINSIFFYVITIFIHEYGHYIVCKIFGYNMDTMVFSLSGAGLYGNSEFKDKHNILISIAGPLVNLITIIFIITFWWIFPTTYLYTYDFFISNTVVMIFNLLPIYPLDGGRIVMSILSLKHISKDKVKKVMLIFSFVLGMVFLVLFIISIFYKTNYTMLFIGMFLTINSIVYDRNKYYIKISSYNKDYGKPLEIKKFFVDNDNKLELLKYISPHYYSIFLIRKNGKIMEIEEKDLLS